MDLETENRLAAILMREAAELRRQSEKEGVLAYLQKPNIRTRPNSRFLTATVRGVQQANRAVEVNEMWRLRQKELELDMRVKEKSIDKRSRDRSHGDDHSSKGTRRHASIDNSTKTSSSSSWSSKREYELDKQVKDTSKEKNSGDRSHRDGNSSGSPGRYAVVDKSTSSYTSCSSEREYDHGLEGLKDEEVEEFLHSRTKRGRGAIGPRMDETGPYLRRSDGEPSASPDVRERRVIYGPEKPLSLRSYESSEEEELHEERHNKSKKTHYRNSDKEHSKKRRSKDKSKHKKKKREEKRSKHHH